MHNPFIEILDQIKTLQTQVASISISSPLQPEIINRDELCKRLDITEPTVIRWEKKGKIPALRIGSNVRYNWPAVVIALQENENK